MINVKTASLAAAVLIAPTKDVRYYLNGVQVKVSDFGEVRVRATNGHIAFEDVAGTGAANPCEFIVPFAVAKLIAKSKAKTVSFAVGADGAYICEGQIFKPIEGVFPDIDRVMPKREKGFEQVVSYYDADLLSLSQKAMRIATGASKSFFRIQNSPCGLMHREDQDFPRVAIMPLHPKKAFAGN